MKRLTRFVLLALGYLVAVARVVGRRFKLGSPMQRAAMLTSFGALFGLSVFLGVSASSAATPYA